MTQFFYLLRWNYLRQKNLFILFTLAQVLLSVSLLFGYPLVIGKMDTTTAYYLASGSVLMGVISIGCTISSPVIANAKSEGHVDYIRALPIPRILISLADLCIWLIAILPGVFFSFLLGCLRFSVQLNLSILSVFVMLLICLTMISLGFSIAYIMYPASRLPDWLDQLYYLLPFVPSANLLRASFYRHGTVSLVDIGVLIFWIFLTQFLILGTLQKEL